MYSGILKANKKKEQLQREPPKKWAPAFELGTPRSAVGSLSELYSIFVSLMQYTIKIQTRPSLVINIQWLKVRLRVLSALKSTSPWRFLDCYVSSPSGFLGMSGRYDIIDFDLMYWIKKRYTCFTLVSVWRRVTSNLQARYNPMFI